MHTKNKGKPKKNNKTQAYYMLAYYMKSPENLLHVGRLRRPTYSGFLGLKYRYFPGGPR